ncbi:2'-5' RNA ligase family protein [uncultured Clostridium sp.]|uniref:2'-5' RNA ligase family protein n=1 Tax=uncultured Clostridium sp. TaxID=59620 RepID=UPI00261694AA|nr:2'-5' RNA ligase family protein [uncultured Clostridium sp.]
MSIRTIMIFPEFENMGKINKIRDKYDPLAKLVRPHITLVFPFESKVSDKELSLHIKEVLKDIKRFELELNGFSKKEDKYGRYLFLNVIKGIEEIKEIHEKLYAGSLKKFKGEEKYIPHMTVGKVASKELLDKAFISINDENEKFKTIIKKISVEMIGEKEESIIILEQYLKGV